MLWYVWYECLLSYWSSIINNKNLPLAKDEIYSSHYMTEEKKTFQILSHLERTSFIIGNFVHILRYSTRRKIVREPLLNFRAKLGHMEKLEIN